MEEWQPNAHQKLLVKIHLTSRELSKLGPTYRARPPFGVLCVVPLHTALPDPHGIVGFRVSVFQVPWGLFGTLRIPQGPREQGGPRRAEVDVLEAPQKRCGRKLLEGNMGLGFKV